MNISEQADTIRARGIGVEYCEDCQQFRKMDDLHREEVSRLREIMAIQSEHCDVLVQRVIKLKARERNYWLGIFALVLVAGLALASNAGWLK